jgi:hypothetical protein
MTRFLFTEAGAFVMLAAFAALVATWMDLLGALQ